MAVKQNEEEIRENIVPWGSFTFLSMDETECFTVVMNPLSVAGAPRVFMLKETVEEFLGRWQQ